MNKRITINVYGRVQGVFFRYTTRKVARKLGLLGRVKNMADGSVYIEAEGPEDRLNKLLEFSRKGPPQARVEKVDFEITESKSQYQSFDYSF